MPNDTITGQKVSELLSVDHLNPDDLLLISVLSINDANEKTYQSRKITKADLFQQLSSQLGHVEDWTFSYVGLDDVTQSITKKVFVAG